MEYGIFCAFQSDRSTTPAASIDSAMESWDSECHDTQLGAPGNGHSVQPMVVSRPLSRVNKSGRSKHCLFSLWMFEKVWFLHISDKYRTLYFLSHSCLINPRLYYIHVKWWHHDKWKDSKKTLFWVTVLKKTFLYCAICRIFTNFTNHRKI